MKSILLVLFLASFHSVFSQDLLKISKNELYGYINSSGNVKIEPQFKAAQEFSEGFAFVVKDDKYGIINKKGKLVVKPKFDHAYPFVNGVAIVSVDSLFGLINTKGKFIIPPEFQRIYFQGEEKIGVKKNDLWGFYSIRSGLPITKIEYLHLGTFHEGLATIQNRYTEKFGFIYEKGSVQISMTLTAVYASGFRNGFAAVCDSNRVNCFIDPSGKNLFNEDYYSLSGFTQGFAFVKKDNYDSGYFIDTTGSRVSQNNFKSAWFFRDGYCGVRTDSSFAVINLNHEIVFESKTMELRFFSNGFGYCCDHSGEKLTWRLMDINMNLVSDLHFVKLFSVPNKNAIEFYFGDINQWYGYSKRGYIDRKGNIIWKEE